MIPQFFDMVKDYEDRLAKAYAHSPLPDHVDHDKIDRLVIDMYDEFVFGGSDEH